MSTEHSPVIAPPEPIAARANVLVVDDENGPRQALRMLLKETYDIAMATGVREAQAILRAKPIDVIVTDLRMPELTGVDLLQWVKNETPHIEVIILTGYGQLQTAMKAVTFGAFAYIEKPFDSTLLLKQVEDALAKRHRELDRLRLEALALEANRFETLGRFVSGMLHDLGSPLSVIGSQVELMKLEMRDQEVNRRLQVMESQVSHCSDIVKATMSFLRQQDETFSPQNLNDVVNACLRIAAPIVKRQSVVVQSILSDDIKPVEGDFVLLRQAVLNLINNACQAMEAQKTERALTFRTWSDGSRVCISIGDSGPGIAPQDRIKVFDTFYSTKGEKGTGIGLAVVKNVVNRHNAEVSIGENPGGGALFLLQFPALDSSV